MLKIISLKKDNSTQEHSLKKDSFNKENFILEYGQTSLATDRCINVIKHFIIEPGQDSFTQEHSLKKDSFIQENSIREPVQTSRKPRQTSPAMDD